MREPNASRATAGAADDEITFVQSFVPPLEAGIYQVSVVQTLTNTNPSGPDDQINEAYVATRLLAVRGERFTLDPGEVVSFFPPANNQGSYEHVLPHIVLRRRTLLWERSPTGQAAGDPWLALLLFEDTDPPPPTQTIRLADLLRVWPTTGPNTSTLPADAVSYPDGYQLLGQRFGLDYGENWTDHCQAIDVPVDLFSQIVPSLDELQWLGHARVIAPIPPTSPGEEPGTYSLMVGNRPPALNTKCTVHLVSLEGMAAYLPTGPNYTPASFPLPGGGQASLIRLVSLQSWSFTSVDPTENFVGYLTSVSVGPLRRTGSFADPPPDPPAETNPASVVATAFGLGYTALNHQTRQGDQTVSWYRGPFVPFTPPPAVFIPPPDGETNIPTIPIETADQLVRYDPNNGLMDVSYAGAWALGRQLALQNKGFSVALCNWRSRSKQAAVRAFMQRRLRDRVGDLLPLPAAGAADTADLRKAGAEFLLRVLKPAAGTPGKRRTGTVPGGRELFRELRELMLNPRELAGLRDETGTSVPPPDSVVQWLARLELLYGVPFNYLVPDEAMLPAESIRFFQLDRNWVYALVQGATSIGRSTAADSAHDSVHLRAVFGPARRARDKGRERDQAGAVPAAVSGFLLRSGVVAGWPNMKVRAYDAQGNLLTPLRKERLSGTLLLFVADGLLAEVVLQEPGDALHFGVDSAKGTLMRYVTVPSDAPHGPVPGDAILGSTPIPVTYRTGGAVQVAALADALQAGLQAASANQEQDGSARPFTAAEFALQLIENAECVNFWNKPAGGRAGGT